MPAEQRVREMHRLLGGTISEPVWRERLEMYLRSLGKWQEAQLVADSGPQPAAATSPAPAPSPAPEVQ